MELKKVIILPVLVIILLLFNCSEQVIVINSGNIQQPNFGIFLFSDDTVGTFDIQYDTLDSFVLRDDPILELDDIDFYDYSTHCLYLNKSKDALREKNSLFGNQKGTPFVFMADGERCYLGTFWNGLSSLGLNKDMPKIFAINWSYLYPEDVIYINNYVTWESEGEVDQRFDDRIKSVLIDAGKYHAGIQVELTDVTIVSVSDIPAVRYTIEIRNNDQDNLYVPDPVKMDGYFFYYSCGLSLHDINDSDGYDNSLMSIYSQSPDPHDSWDFEWFTRIDSGESITREYTIIANEDIKTGEYECKLWYTGPKNINKEARNRPDGRIWIGRIWSSSFYLTVSNSDRN